MVREIREKGFIQKFRDNFSDFKFFAFLGVFTLVIGLTFYLTTKQQDIRQRASGEMSTEFGFNTHLNASGEASKDANLTLDFFKKTVDDLVVNQQKWIRFNIIPGESASLPVSSNTYVWNETNMQKYDEAINYAKSKGLKVFLITATPDFASSGSSDNYKAITIKYHTELAARFKGKIDVWQIFNEADTINYQPSFYGNHPALSNDLAVPYPTNYLADLKTNFEEAKKAIHEVDSNVQFTANVTGFPISQPLFDKWSTYFAAIAPSLDILSFDLYPQNASEITIIKSALAGIASQYSKPFIIAETGFTNGTFSESDQAALLSQTLDQIRALNPKAILYYEYSDTLPTTNKNIESGFGVVKADGTQKSSYSLIMKMMRNQTGLLRVETNPAVGATITVTDSKTGTVVLAKQWGIDWEKLAAGNYKISFSNPTNLTIYGKPAILPDDTYFTIFADQTTTITADLTKGTQTITPTPVGVPTGLLRVETNPAVGVTINITSNGTGQTVLTKQWGIDWEKLPIGNYKITYSNPTNLTIYGKPAKLPQDNYLTIFDNQTTTVVANLMTGTQTISPNPVGIPATPTPLPSTGLLRVETKPPTNSTITVFKSVGGTIVFQQPWSIDWKPIDTGSYYVMFSNPNNSTTPPKLTSFTINSGRTTELVADFTTGKTSIVYH